MVPLGNTSLTALLPVSATNTSPAPSTATPLGVVNPEPIVWVLNAKLKLSLGDTS